MSRLRPCLAPGELHASASHAVAAAGNDNDDGKPENSHHNPRTSWVPSILIKTQVPPTSSPPLLDFDSWLSPTLLIS